VYIVDLWPWPVTLAPKQLVLAGPSLANRPHISVRRPTWPTTCLAQAPGGSLARVNLPLRPVVVGFGPCGIFAALMLAQMGLKPIVLERGREVRQRTKDTWGLWRKSVLDPESNVQFGEGGAGTFSDGKLWSQIKDPRYLGRKVMEEFVKAGAPEEILTEAHPHIGTFKLVKVVENMRAQIIALGGEIRFEQRLIDIAFDEVGADASGRSRRVRVLTVRDLIRGTDYDACRHAMWCWRQGTVRATPS
jgi:uncharacterized FAD-dependent dehydrogenase